MRLDTLGVLFVLVAFAVAMPIAPIASASYTITHLNTTLVLYKNNTATVTEVYALNISNSSLPQYNTARGAFNLTLSEWQTIIGPTLVQHILNPSNSVSDLRFFPGPVTKTYQGNRADLTLGYSVHNVTTQNRTNAREIEYYFNPSVFNFQHEASGEVLPQNTTLTMTLPAGAVVRAVYPTPDYPQGIAAGNYTNVSAVSWHTGEPLSKFELKFQMTESLVEEVQVFIGTLYAQLGIFLYVIVAAAVLGFIVYAYLKAS